MADIVKIYPTEEKLLTINNHLICPEQSCSKNFTSESNLNFHLVKTHKQTQLMLRKFKHFQFHCPNTECVYNSTKYFVTMKQIKQHFLKVHSSKDFKCEVCNKGFPTESSKNYHTEFCGITFKCCDCEISYPCYESLKTHGRRKNHNILNKQLYKLNLPLSKNTGENTDVESNCSKPCRILPKLSNNCQVVVMPYIVVPLKINDDMSDKSTQTCFDMKSVTSTTSNKSVKKQSSQETQTSERKKPKLTVETQTTGDYVLTKKHAAIDSLSNSVSDVSKLKSVGTQTYIESKSTSCNTSFNVSDLEFTLTNDTEKFSISTQTNIEEDFINDQLHVESNLDIDGFCDNFDSNFFNCNMETQTDFIFKDEFLNCDYYANMYTQTCENMLLNDIGFNDNETQTVFNDMLRSVKSQTVMSHTKKSNPSSRDISHIETQTEIKFEKMLEEINS